ncbi:MAG TPA: PBP1A family penicillin-binding protein [Pyrinomonadaceae bacterium]|nr:PBP1A family penicillin-binding protein [Pyrinomonadaceae bacterium]
MDRSALASGALRLLTGRFSRQKQSPKISFSNAALQRRQKATAQRWHNRRVFRRTMRIAAVACAIATVSLSVVLISSYRSYARLVDERLTHGYLTSRAGIYAAPRTLRAGQKITRAGLAVALRRAGYIESDAVSEVWNGSFRVEDAAIEIKPSSRETSPAVVRVTFDGRGRIRDLLGDGVTLDSFTLAPESLTNDAFTKGAARRQLTFKDIPPVLVHAITSIEDRRFFDHHGLDIFGVGRALIRNAGQERIGQGGSSITQQLIKNTYLTPERTFRRKYAEAMLSFSLERRLSKQDIFALYCNEVYLGQRNVVGVRGVDQAARVYFGKDLQDLTLVEAATLAGMIQSPARYSPVRSPDETRMRRNTVLATMVRDGHITLAQAAAAAQEPLSLANFDPARESSAPYFVDYANREAPEGDKQLVTTIDLDLQAAAEQATRKQVARLDDTYKARGATPQVALVALDPNTGEVLAMVGGRDYAESQLNRATDAKRQPGSVFKPFVYAAALESGISPLAKFTDAPRSFTYAGTAKYRPANFGGGFSMRDVPMRDGLINSLNVVTVDVAMQTGLARTANIASDFGLPRPEPFPALALGTTEVTPLQMAAAYAVFANGGSRIQPRVVKSSGDAQPGAQVIQPSTAFIVTNMLEGVIDHGTATRARALLRNTALAGKTGTSRDGWFVGYTPNLVVAVWVGFDDNKQLGMTGGEAALPIWMDFMKSAVDLRPELGGKLFAQPEDVALVDVDPASNQITMGACPQHERIAILLSQQPTTECLRHNPSFDFAESSETVEPMMAKHDRRFVNPARPPLEKLTSPGETRVDTDASGRRVLVNEMRSLDR